MLLSVVEVVELLLVGIIEEHYARKSTISNDMQEFLDCVNNIGVEDLCMSGMFYTWIKSPSSPNTSILKKLDRVMENDEFTSKFKNAREKVIQVCQFHLRKSDFLPIVASVLKIQIDGFHMFQVVKKLKLLKKPLNNLQWKNGDVFERVTCLRSKLKSAQLEVSLFPRDTEKKKIVVSIFEEFSEAIDDEEKLLFQKAKVEWLSEGDSNTTYFHRMVKSKRNRNRIMRINNEKGDCLEGSHIADEFVNHFDKILGQSYHVVQLDSLGDIFTNFLTSNEAKDMVKGVTDLEIKNAMFGIGDSKAPGPDGYTTCFFKKAWPIIGNDVCYAIKEFFKTGKILKEINSTLIALIPKTPNPKLVTEFRPIACCNDNILLTQELLKGYNRKGGSKRSAIKIDIAKAYDTISWEFLRSILIKFGFHLKVVDWITTCISSSSFSICVNGEIHGSPSHFRYIRCKDLMLTHLYFVNDLIVLYHGDKSSISIIKEALEEFNVISRLKPNLSKSTIFFGNVNNGEQRSILKVLPFKVGSFPAKYLGVPLVTKRLGREDCKHLVDMEKNKVNDWKNKFLSYAGRMQLIASVLGSMQIYWASVFLLPKSTVKDIERVLKGFLWCQGDLARGKAKIAWKTLCKPKCQGGLGFKDLGLWNEVLLTKHVWNIWVWHQEWSTSFPDLITLFVPLLNDKQDKVIWRGNDGNVKIFSTRQTWHDYRPYWPEDKIFQWNKDATMKCSLCNTCMDSHDHLFFVERRSVKDLCDIMMDNVKLRLLSLKVKSSSNVKQVAKDWDIKFRNIQPLE
ncbi:RNA-directed DNA polymerase, eukaryota, reverse transcriptase zinc-binding domain protein [Tanacetum coccineum]